MLTAAQYASLDALYPIVGEAFGVDASGTVTLASIAPEGATRVVILTGPDNPATVTFVEGSDPAVAGHQILPGSALGPVRIADVQVRSVDPISLIWLG